MTALGPTNERVERLEIAVREAVELAGCTVAEVAGVLALVQGDVLARARDHHAKRRDAGKFEPGNN